MDEKYEVNSAQTFEPIGLDANSGEVAALLQTEDFRGVVGLGKLFLVSGMVDGPACVFVGAPDGLGSGLGIINGPAS